MTNKISDPIHADGIGSLSGRLQELLGSQSVRSFAQGIGVSETAVRKYLKGAIPGLDIAIKIASQSGVQLEWFATGNGDKYLQGSFEYQAKVKSLENNEINVISDVSNEKNTLNIKDFHEEFVLVPGYHIQVSAGNGTCAIDAPIKRYLAFRRKYIKYKGLDSNKLAVVFVKGDSMEPTIKDNDSLLIDLSCTNPIDGKLFVVRLGDELYAKRVQKSYDGSIRLISDNKDYQPIEVPKSELAELCIIGRVVQRATDL
ncbi:LexA family transcriptional regulator [Photobacterium sanguinicancri]|uniref:LexA family transcriptional regulator n=1 Tax=Photobacterium sanguinicancri TaxID=875932 RepID=UPI0026E12C33|nr:LexA family transcriptional regulator [Photobacterium sanguinicancri]MDO6497360.1 LexA family transcriptional regulator [Photobacterium sanguinicancri]